MLKTILQRNFVITWAMRWQFIGIDFFENFKVMVIFGRYDGSDVRVIIFGFLQGSVDFIKG
jgi:hypothetical protein